MEELYSGKWTSPISKDNLPSSKSLKYGFLILVILSILLSFTLSLTTFNTDKQEIFRTTLEITNESSKDSVLTYLTLGADTNFVTDVNGIFGSSGSGLMGYFWMVKDSVYTYDYTDKGISGNISFGTSPLNCLSANFPTGVNLFEFTLNNEGINDKAQETIDISNVAGVNALGKFNVTDTNWIANGKKVTGFYNDTLYGNLGLVGVYPFKCDTCTGSKKPPTCLNSTKTATPQLYPTCNVSRSAKLSGGIVRITFLGFTK
jgi:hypothetical protein